jgi:hypothetical protein
MKSHRLARLGIHGDSHPLLVRLLLHNAGHCVGFFRQALDQRSGLVRDEVLCEAIDTLASTLFPLMMLFPIVDMPVFLVVG